MPRLFTRQAEDEVGAERQKSLRNLVQVVYVLYALSYFAGITAIGASSFWAPASERPRWT